MIKKLPLLIVFMYFYGLSLAQTPQSRSQVKAGTENKPVQSGLSNSVPQEHRKADSGTDNQNIASRYSNMFAKLLNLDAGQHEKVNQFTITRITAMRALPNGTGQSGKSGTMSEDERQIRSQFVQEMDNILTPEQKIKWNQYRLQIRQRKENIKNGQKDVSIKSDNPASKNTVLMKEDDGFDD